MNQSKIYDVFDAGGLLEEKFPHFEFRQGQLDMALLVEQAFDKAGIAVIEAGTGIGKSFAYLVPAILRALVDEEERTVIATSTINLQMQLFEKDLVQLLTMLEVTLPTALVMGRSNYLCPARLREYAREETLLAEDSASPVAKLLAWSETTQTGLRIELPFACPEELWSKVCSEQDSCRAFQCAQRGECFFFNSRKIAAQARLIVTNHHLLFTDAAYREADGLDYSQEAVLPSFANLIIDEAHNIERNATDYFTNTYSSGTIAQQIGRLVQEKRRGGKTLLDLLGAFSSDKRLVEQLHQQLGQLKSRSQDLDTYLISFMQGKRQNSLLIKVEQQGELVAALPYVQALLTALQETDVLMQALIKSVTLDAEYQYLLDAFVTVAQRFAQSGRPLADFFNFAHWSDDVYWLQVVKRGVVEVHISPISIATTLQAQLFSQLKSVICTSATLDLGDEFAFWSSRVGLPPPATRPYYTGIFPSPFDFKQKLMLLTPTDAPHFSEAQAQPYMHYISELIKEAVVATEGGALVLFTSYQMLQAVTDAVRGELESHNIHVLRQGEAQRHRLMQSFLADKNSVLMATDSFWEGIDAPGETLRLVIITKLPFKVPNDPVFQSRQEYLEQQGRSGFFHLALPEATMRLKQGFGRLLRNTVDSGIVLLLDSRVVQKSYGQWMLRALPESFHPESTTDSVVEKIENFLYS